MTFVIAYGLVAGCFLPLLWLHRVLRRRRLPTNTPLLSRREFRYRLAADFLGSAVLLCSSLGLIGRFPWALILYVFGAGMIVDSGIRMRSQPGLSTRSRMAIASILLSLGAVASMVLLFTSSVIECSW